MAVNNSTISSNASEAGGGIYHYAGTLTVTNSTVANNQAQPSGASGGAGGIHNKGTDSAVVTLHNTIVAGSYRDADVEGTFDAASSHNLIGNIHLSTGLDIGTGTLYGTLFSPLAPKLGPLADLGGPTRTHALLSDSPALDAGSRAPLTRAVLAISLA